MDFCDIITYVIRSKTFVIEWKTAVLWRFCMSAKVKITKDVIIDAGFEIVREEGEEKLSVRNIAKRLGCSTQPIMYCYPKTDVLRSDILEKANAYHTKFLARSNEDNENILIYIGMNYIRFAEEEKNLFRFIFLSDKNEGSGMADIINNEDILKLVAGRSGIRPEQAKDVFESLFVSFHGYATMIAYKMIEFDEKHCRKQLNRIYIGTVKCIKTEDTTIIMS